MTTERDFELADEIATAERDAGRARASAQIAAVGREACIDCGEMIDTDRRVAAPFATRCMPCQRSFERSHRNA